MIAGDFNFHVDDPENRNALRFLDMLNTFDLQQSVTECTHKKGHILDLLLSHPSDELVDDVSTITYETSDHYWVHCSLLGPKPRSVKKKKITLKP